MPTTAQSSAAQRLDQLRNMTGPTSNVKVVFGAMTFGAKGERQTRVHDLEDCSKILDIFQGHGHNEIDTARFYGGGTSEEYLGKLDYTKRGIVMDTKYYPTAGKGMGVELSHKPADVRENLLKSLKALGQKKVDMFYLHAPDRTTPYELTLSEIDVCLMSEAS